MFASEGAIIGLSAGDTYQRNNAKIFKNWRFIAKYGDFCCQNEPANIEWEEGVRITLTNLIADRINQLRKARKLSVNKLADISGLPYSTVNSILRGKSKTPNLGTIFRISSALNMTIVEFLDVPEILEYSFDDMDDTDEDNALKEGDS